MIQRLNNFLETQTGLLLLLFSCMVVFSGLTTLIIFCAPANEKAFLLFSNLLTGFASSLLTAAQVRHSANRPDTPEKPENMGGEQ